MGPATENNAPNLYFLQVKKFLRRKLETYLQFTICLSLFQISLDRGAGGLLEKLVSPRCRVPQFRHRYCDEYTVFGELEKLGLLSVKIFKDGQLYGSYGTKPPVRDDDVSLAKWFH